MTDSQTVVRKLPRLSPDATCNGQSQGAHLWPQPWGSLLSALVLKYQCCSERAALPGDLELKRTGARDLFKEPVGGARSIFKEK